MLTKYARISKPSSRDADMPSILSGDRRITPQRRKHDRLMDNVLSIAEVIVLVVIVAVIYFR
jgi:hypothetical protein